MNSEIASRFEHALPTPFGLRAEVERVCAEAREEGFRAVVVPSSLVAHAYELLEGSETKVSALIGFPLGWSDADAKRFEIDAAIDAGAHEIEYVPSLARLKERRYLEVLREMRDADDASDEHPLKVSIEASLWTPEELAEIIKAVLDSGAKYVATGLIGSLELIEQVRELVGPQFGIKCELAAVEMAEAALGAGADVFSVARLGLPGARKQGFGI